MLKRVFIIAISIILLTNCTWHHVNTSPKPEPKMVVPGFVSENIAEFNKIKINGKINVNVYAGSRSHKIVFYGVKEDIKGTERAVKNGELSIKLGKKIPKYGYMKVDIYLNKLTSFNFHGTGVIVINGLRSNCLDLDIDNNENTTISGSFGLGRAKLANSGYYNISGVQGCATNLILRDKVNVRVKGYSNVAHLNMGDDSQINLYWVKSKTIRIKLKDNARAELSGVAEVFHSEQWDKSHLYSRNLISQISFVKTHDLSEAYISVVKNQHTLAKDKSNIYYYSLPETNNNFMAKDGSVLDMREWHFSVLK